MKLSTLRTLTLSLSAIIAPVGLMAQAPIHATIPFDFTVGSKLLTAGEYQVKELNHIYLAVQKVDGKSNAVVLANRSGDHSPSGKVSLTFRRYGTHYFLAKVAHFDQGWEVTKSRSEKAVLSKMTPATQIELAAAISK